MGVVADIERKLARERCRQEADGDPELRTSTMTHVVWCPPRWLPRAKRVLAGLAERHPARTIFLIPVPGRSSAVEASAVVRDFATGDGREVLSEVIELRLRGDAAQHPASIVHARYDMVCPIVSADELARAWPGARYNIVADAGHSVWEPSVRAAVLAELERFKEQLG